MRVTQQPKKIVGIELRTSNMDGQAMKEIPDHWSAFYIEGVQDQIPNKTSDKIYGVYTNYDGDHTQPYSLILGCEVSEIPADLPAGLVACQIEGGTYSCPPIEGAFPQSMFQAWMKVWNGDLKRAFSTDFEMYDESFDPLSGESDGATLFIALK